MVGVPTRVNKKEIKECQVFGIEQLQKCEEVEQMQVIQEKQCLFLCLCGGTSVNAGSMQG